MANNRLYIRDTYSGELFFLAKSSSPRGWRLACTPEEFNEWAEGRDLVAVDGDKDTLLELETDVT